MGFAPLSAAASSQHQYVLGDAPAHGTICREKPVFAGKVTCGVRNETSGQSWPSNTLATDPFTGQYRNSNGGSREIALPRELGALKGPVLSDVSFEGSAIIRAGGSTHPLLQATPDMGRTRWILILCAWTIVGLLFAVRRIVLVKLMGSPVSWVTLGALELVYWYVWAAYTPLVIGLAKRFPLTGPRFVRSYSDPHNRVAHHGSPGSSHRIRSEPWTSAVSFSHT